MLAYFTTREEAVAPRTAEAANPEPSQLTTTPSVNPPLTPFPPASQFGSPRLKICASNFRFYAKLQVLGRLGSFGVQLPG